jgi:hypothetical protein
MKKQNLIALFSIAFVIFLSTTSEVSAQRYLTEIRSGSEAKGIARFADDLSEFLSLAETIEQDNAVSPIQLGKLERAGKKVKDGAGNLRSHIKGFVTQLKDRKQWDEQLDTEINDLFGSRKIKGFFKRNGGRKILTDADAAIASVSRDVDTIINNAKNSKSAGVTVDGIFAETAFAVSPSGRKLRLKCVVLGVAIFGAELVKADRTAENLDGIFDKSCGSGATTAT